MGLGNMPTTAITLDIVLELSRTGVSLHRCTSWWGSTLGRTDNCVFIEIPSWPFFSHHDETIACSHRTKRRCRRSAWTCTFGASVQYAVRKHFEEGEGYSLYDVCIYLINQSHYGLEEDLMKKCGVSNLLRVGQAHLEENNNNLQNVYGNCAQPSSDPVKVHLVDERCHPCRQEELDHWQVDQKGDLSHIQLPAVAPCRLHSSVQLAGPHVSASACVSQRHITVLLDKHGLLASVT